MQTGSYAKWENSLKSNTLSEELARPHFKGGSPFPILSQHH